MSRERPQDFVFINGNKQLLPFPDSEYQQRLADLRATMAEQGVEAAVLTSMHNVAYYSGFLYCSFGRPYGVVVTPDACVTISAASTAGNPGAAASATA